MRSIVQRATSMPGGAAENRQHARFDQQLRDRAACGSRQSTGESPSRSSAPAARARSRLAMLAQAMSSTSAVTPSSRRSGVRASPWMELCPRAAVLHQQRLRLETRHRLVAHALLQRRLDVVDDLRDTERSAPSWPGRANAGLQPREAVDPVAAPILELLPARLQEPAQRDWNKDLRRRPRASCRSKSFGATPTIVSDWPLTMIVSLRTLGSAPKRDCHQYHN